jgi:hypothetical protein
MKTKPYKFHIASSLIFLLSVLPMAFATESSRYEWLPSGRFFQPIILDRAVATTNASMLSYNVKGSDAEKLYSPVNIGIQKMILRSHKNTNEAYEFGVEFGVHSQFTIVDSGETLMGGLQNADYRIGAVFNYKYFDSVFRISLFHQSSHLGDDYMLRNDYLVPNTRILNYEQIDVTHSIQKGHARVYYGIGYNFSPNTARKRLALQGGYFYSKPFLKNNNIGWLYGVDVKIYEQNEYEPNFNAGLGLEFGRNAENPFMIILEYYKGHLPFSTLEYQEVQLFGLGLHFHF